MERRSLIIFAKLPRPGEVKTRLGHSIGMAEAAEVYKQFAAHTFGVARQLQSENVETFVFYAPGASSEEVARWAGLSARYCRQEGKTLGERMQHAFDTTFRNGTQKSVIIGTDIPELTVESVRSAFDALATFDVVIGPSHDGGYYLLGMKNETKHLFEGIAWSSAAVLEQTLNRISKLNLTSTLLSPLHDVDTAEDYAEFLRRTISTR